MSPSQIRSANLRLTFESQIHLGFVFEKQILDESETQNPISDLSQTRKLAVLHHKMKFHGAQ